MSRKITAFLSVVCAVSSGSATEFRAPLPTERGPLRYIFEERDKDSYRLDMWTTYHDRESHKAFLKHGTNTNPLTRLFFNECDFRLNGIFPNSKIPINTELYNPYMRVIRIRPRATYHERGASFGGRVDFPVWGDKGRVGVRATVPFRDIKIEKEDQTELDDAQLQNLVVRESGTALRFQSDADKANNPQTFTVVTAKKKKAYRYDLVEALPQNKELLSMIEYSSEGLVDVATQAAHEDANNGGSFSSIRNPKIVVVASPEGIIPRNEKVGVVIKFPGANLADQVTPPFPPFTSLPADLNVNPNTDGFFAFDAIAKIDYTGLDVDSEQSSSSFSDCCREKLRADRKAQLWFTSVHDPQGGQQDDAQQAIAKIEDALNQYNENVFEWMSDRGFVFETHKLMGLGDIDVDLFYEHTFSDHFIMEAFLGVRFPTGNGSKYHDNPYRVHLGNGEHFEIKLGLMAAWQPISWFNFKADAFWSFVLEDKELRAASFCGACIKNIGPCVPADIDWGYLIINADFNFFHPKDKKLSSMIGYQFYYKTEDDVHFGGKNCPSKIAAWFGRRKIVTDTNITFEELTFALDNKGLEKNTEAIAHRLRWETGYRFSHWFEAFAGGAWTWAGQNIAKEVDFHGGVNIRFQ